MKQSLVIVLALIASITTTACGNNSGKEYDTRAIEALDQLSNVIGEMESCSFTLEADRSKKIDVDNWQTISSESDVYMRGPDKLYVHTVGDQGNKGFWYNGSELATFSFTKNTYDTVPVTGNIIEAIDFIHNKYDVDFPAADFFYPSLTDDIMEDFDKVYYMGEQVSGDKTYVLIEASNDNQRLNIWIDKSTSLPAEFEIFRNNNEEHYAAQFLNWKINPSIGDVVFDFLAPSDANRVALKAKAKD